MAIEFSTSQRLGEEVGHFGGCRHVGDDKDTLFHEIANKEMSMFNVFGPLVVLGVIGEVACSTILSVANAKGVSD